MLSRVLGFVRDTLIVHFLGKCVWYELFLIAYKSTNWMRRFFAEGAMNVSLIPELSKRQNDPEKFGKLAQNTFSLVLFSLSFFVICMEIFAPILVPILISKYQGEELAHLILLVQINFPYALLISLCAICSAVLNVHQKFYAESALPIILNLSVIGAVLFCRNMSAEATTIGMSFGVLIAGIIQIGWLYWLCRKHHFTFRIQRPKWSSDETSLVLRKTGKNSLVAFANQINLFVDLYLATLLPTGAITFLVLADRINQFPLSIIGVALSAVLLPNFAKNINDFEKTKDLFHNAFLGAMQMALPITFLFIILANPMFYVLFYHGKFTLMDTMQTAQTLQFYAFGIPFVILSKIFLSFLFANNISKVPLIAAVTSVALNIVISLSTIFYIGYIGIAIATAVAACCNFLCLSIYAYNAFPGLFDRFYDVAKLLLWSLVTFTGFYYLKNALFFNLYNSRLENMALVFVLSMFFLTVYFVIGYSLGMIKIPYKAVQKA